MTSAGNQAGPTASGKEVNIAVVVRARPLNTREVAHSSKSAVRINTSANVIEISQQNRQQAKTYFFDKVFDETASQEFFYRQVVSPVVKDFLDGFNCTLFAYGQTGTGKTYTMIGDQGHFTGDRRVKYVDFSTIPHAGMIPRVSNEIFSVLDSQNADYQVRVSHMEVYCEEIYDLLKDSSDEREALKLFEERSSYGVTPKGHRADEAKESKDSTALPSTNLLQPGDKAGGRLVILGLEEVLVKSPGEIMSLLIKSTENRRVAETKMNSSSSRSHSIFTICLIVKETAPSSNNNTDIDVIRISKLNLVDLAGSESAGKSGASGDRQQEASKINKSLLTLGRVINALTETKQHIPYRESKLTRLLQDSLGGRTKTCIIATITTADLALDETTNTLEYMSRAKKIKNLPEVTTKISGKSVLKEYSLEIKRLRELLSAQKDAQGGIFLTVENYDEMNEAARVNKAQIADLEARIQQATKEMERVTALLVSGEQKVEKLKLALNKTVEKVNELHEEKCRLYEKIVLGRDKEKINAAQLDHLRANGASLILENVFGLDSLRHMIDKSGISSAIIEIEKTVSACKAELSLFSKALTQVLDEHKRNLDGGLEKLLEKLMVPVLKSSAEVLGTSIPGLLETDLLGKLSSEMKSHLMEEARQGLSSFIVNPQIELLRKLTEGSTASLGLLDNLSSALDKSSESVQLLLQNILVQIQVFAEKETAFLSGLDSFLAREVEHRTHALVSNLEKQLQAAHKSVLSEFTEVLRSSTQELKDSLANQCNTQHGRIGVLTDTVDTWRAKDVPTVVERYADITRQLSELRSSMNLSQAIVSSHTDSVKDATSKYEELLERSFDKEVTGSIAAPITKSIKQLTQIGETLMDMMDAFTVQLGSISNTSHATLVERTAQLSHTYIQEGVVDKLLSGAVLDSTIRDSAPAISLLAADLEKDCLATADGASEGAFAMVTNMAVCSISDLISRFEASVASAFSTLVSNFHLTPVIQTGGSSLQTPALATPNVRPISLAQTHTEFVYGVVTPSVPLNKSISNKEPLATMQKLNGSSNPTPTKAPTGASPPQK